MLKKQESDMRATTKVERRRFGCEFCAESACDGCYCMHENCAYESEFDGYDTYGRYLRGKKSFIFILPDINKRRK